MEKDAPEARETRLKGEARLNDMHLKSPKIASSSAAGSVSYSIEEGEDALNVLMEKRAAIFDDTKEGSLSLSKHHKAVFWYRRNRRQEWQAAAAETMLNESE